MTRLDLPTGTVTFLFTDVEGSTKLLHALGDAAYADALGEHRRLLREAFARHGGVEVDTQGDAFFVAFPTATGAIDAAEAALEALDIGPITVRIGIHTGDPLTTDEGYVGIDVHRAARVAAVAHGGQVLITASTAQADGRALHDLGDHHLKDLAAPERLFQLGDGSFPPLKSISPSHLPTPATPFVGREPEVARVAGLLRDPDTRLLTITGPGGIGKTRLAIEAATEAIPSFPGGLWWVALAPLQDPTVVETAIADALTLRDEGTGIEVGAALDRQLAGRRTLLLLDNAEHLLPPIAERIGSLLAAAPSVVALVTSRERLQLSAERVVDVPVMTAEDAEAFFLSRADAAGARVERSDSLTALLERLDRLPLALQLAAARLRIFSVDQLLERLSARLDLLEGDRDADPRQRTLRTTIGWSHDLLTDEEQVLFRRLCVFAGGGTLAAVEAVVDGEPDALSALLDKALVQRRDGGGEPRFWMLESIRSFAEERSEAAGELADLRARHAGWYRDLAEDADRSIRGGDPEEIHVAVLEAEIGNLRSALSFGVHAEDHDLVRSIVASLPMYWIMRGRLSEARGWIERALEIDRVQDDVRRRLLSSLATIASLQGDHEIAVEAADEAADLASELGGATDRIDQLREQGLAALLRGDWASAEPVYEELFALAVEVGNGVRTSASRLNLATIANKNGRYDRAEELLRENLTFVRSRGQSRCEATTLAMLAETAIHQDRGDAVSEPARVAAVRSSQISDEPLLIYSLELVAAGAAEDGEGRRAAILLGATDAARERMELEPDDDEAFVREWVRTRLPRTLSADDIAAASEAGGRLELDAALTEATAGSR